MLFEKVNKEHIIKGIKDFEEKGIPTGFGPSSTYDVVFEGKKYPPPSIMAYAYLNAEGKEVESNFKVGKNSECFNVLKQNGFIIEKKKHIISYKEYEKQIYHWLNNKNEQDPSFTFSLRQKGAKGAESDYFIGTEKSRYFAITFWSIPVAFPGSSGDCIGLVFKLSQDYKYYSYDFKFTQTNSPNNEQNQSVLNLVKSLSNGIEKSVGTKRISGGENKMFTIRSKPKQEKYSNLEVMLKDIDDDLFKLIPIIDAKIEEVKKQNPTFEAHRISKEEFANMKSKLLVRFDKYGQQNNDNKEVRFEDFLKNSVSEGTVKTYLSAIRSIEKLAIKEQFNLSSIYDFDNSVYFREFWSKLKDNKAFVNTNVRHHNRFSSALLKYDEFLKFNLDYSAQQKTQYKSPLNQIFYGPPGTGKTYQTILEAAKIITQDESISYEDALEEFQFNLGKNLEFITFHQNYSYEDFIQGLRPDTDVSGELSFIKSDGVFKKLADKALKNLRDAENPETAKKDFIAVFNELTSPLNEGDVDELEIKMKKTSFYITEIGEKSIEFRKNQGESKHTLSIGTLNKMYDKGVNDLILGGLQPYYNPILEILLEKGKSAVEKVEKQNFVIIIDEINRANISRVFGELITLIEKDKRSEGAIPLTATLPSGEKFMVPSNLYIIGTMNTADKSIALLDIALRRRFEFVPMYPDSNSTETKIVHDAKILDAINNEIINRKGHDFTIGHSYFMGEEYDLKNTIDNKVIPLLLEYFMNDFEEVKKILKAAEINVDGWPMKYISND